MTVRSRSSPHPSKLAIARAVMSSGLVTGSFSSIGRCYVDPGRPVRCAHFKFDNRESALPSSAADEEAPGKGRSDLRARGYRGGDHERVGGGSHRAPVVLAAAAGRLLDPSVRGRKGAARALAAVRAEAA